MPDKPTSRQLNYLRALANRTGQTFTYPTTVAEASREIERLEQAQPATRLDNRLIDREIADAIACGDADADTGAELGSLRPRVLGHMGAPPRTAPRSRNPPGEPPPAADGGPADRARALHRRGC